MMSPKAAQSLDLLLTFLLSSLGRVSVGPILEEDMSLTVFNGRTTFAEVSMAEQLCYFVVEEEDC